MTEQREALERLGTAIYTISRWLWRQGFDHEVLSSSQMVVLKLLAGRDTVTVSEVAHCLEASLAAATGLVDRMEKAGLVARERDVTDRRVVRVRLTPAGQQALADARERRLVALQKAFGDMPPDDLGLIVQTIEQVVSRLPAG